MGKQKRASKDRRRATPLLRHLSSVEPYPPGRPIEEVQREYGLAEVVKLASNENALGPSPRAAAAMRNVADEMNLYPDGGGYYLRGALAKHLGVVPEEITLGNGSDEITLLMALCYLKPGRSIVTSQYSFIRYRMAADLMNARTKSVPMKKFRHDDKALAAAVDRSTVAVFIDNPCNPTGAMMTARELGRLLRAVRSDVFVVVDEAYYEYARGDSNYPDTLALRKKHANLIVMRTFSKAYGLAGLRLGYGVARREVTHDLERVRPPFNTTRVAQAAAVEALRDRAHLRRSIANNEKGKRYLGAAFEKLGVEAWPTRGNFFLVGLGGSGLSGAEVNERLLRKGVIVRPMGGYGLPNHLRISIGTPKENQKLIAALRDIVT